MAELISEHPLTRRGIVVTLAILAALAVLAYLPTLSQPLMEDDYNLIAQSLHFGDDVGWSKMFAELVFRVRATTFLLDYAVNDLFEMHAPAYYAATILMHVACTWLLFALGAWSVLGYRVTAVAAGFFAVYEGHQEAVMWLSGSTEAMQMLFGMLAFLCWLRVLTGSKPGRYAWYIPALVAFAVALLTKESSVIFVALFALPIFFNDDAPAKPATLLAKFLRLIPFAILAAISAFSIAETSKYSYRFTDGGFSLHAPFWIIWPDSFARLFWFWGLLALITIFWLASRSNGFPPRWKKILAIALAWAGLSLIPYSFLTYQHRVPSRHTYLPSAGVSLIVGLAMVELYDRSFYDRSRVDTGQGQSLRRAAVRAIAAIIVISNIAYLWTKKREQYRERAAPTEQLIAFARATKSPIYVACFPKARITAEAAVELMVDGRSAADLVWTPEEARARNAATFCYQARR